MTWYESTVAELERRSVFDWSFPADQRRQVEEIIVREGLDWRDAMDARWCWFQHWREMVEQRRTE